jgi:hypothetical protein
VIPKSRFLTYSVSLLRVAVVGAFIIIFSAVAFWLSTEQQARARVFQRERAPALRKAANTRPVTPGNSTLARTAASSIGFTTEDVQERGGLIAELLEA